MSQSGDAADQVVNMAANVATKVAEVGADVAIKGSVALGTFLIAALKDQKRTKGRVRLQSFHGKPTKVFTVQREQLKDFAIECKKYGVMYAAVFSKKDPNGLVDIIINDADAAKVNRIAERFGMSAVDVENLRNEILRSRKAEANGPQNADAVLERTDPAAEHAINDAFLDELLNAEPAAPVQKQPFVMDENPTMARTDEVYTPFVLLSGNNESFEAISNEERPSVRQEIRALKAGRAERERQRGLPEPERSLALPPGKEQPQHTESRFPQLPPPIKNMDKGR